jgi:antibiotic biosynthesis monooxygenase (ABM) superfamily enzyme
VSFGYYCEECEEAAFFTTTRSELQWLKRRQHIVAEVAKHMSTGLDAWMADGLEFLEKHPGHPSIIVER